MRFTKEKQLREAYWEATKKTKTKFLWWPMTIDGETRWLETAKIEYRVQRESYMILPGHNYSWEPMRFINE